MLSVLELFRPLVVLMSIAAALVAPPRAYVKKTYSALRAGIMRPSAMLEEDPAEPTNIVVLSKLVRAFSTMPFGWARYEVSGTAAMNIGGPMPAIAMPLGLTTPSRTAPEVDMLDNNGVKLKIQKDWRPVHFYPDLMNAEVSFGDQEAQLQASP